MGNNTLLKKYYSYYFYFVTKADAADMMQCKLVAHCFYLPPLPRLSVPTAPSPCSRSEDPKERGMRLCARSGLEARWSSVLH